MPSRRRFLTILAVSVGAGASAYAYRWYRRAHAPLAESTGDYKGPLTRAIAPYDLAGGKPSRPWLLAAPNAAPPLTYHTYPASAIGGQPTDYLLYLPPGYDDPANAARRYPVIYWLHGYEAEPQHGGAFVDALDAAVRAGRCPPAMVVLPNGLNDSWFCDSSDGRQPVERVLLTDLIPHVDATYRTTPDRRARALEGFSMGGWAAAHLACKHPGTFCAATAVCAPFHAGKTFYQLWPVFNNDPAAYYAEDPVTRIRRDGDRLKSRVRLRLLCGDRDVNIDFNRHLHERLTAWKFPHEYAEASNVSAHADSLIYDRLGKGAFEFYRSVFAEAPGRASGAGAAVTGQ